VNLKFHVEKIIDDLYILRLDDDSTKYFEALWHIPEGVTYNSYILVTREGAVLYDTWKNKYSDLFIEALTRVVDPRDVKHIIVHHMEPDHSGALPEVLKYSTNAIVYGHPLARDMIRSFYRIEPKFRAVRDGEVIEVSGYRLEFIHTPWLHWPETIMTFIENLGVLLSCDAFGSFSIPHALFDDEMSDDEIRAYLEYARKYTISVVGHYRSYITHNVEKLNKRGITPKIIAPAHGLVWRGKPSLIVEKYLEWAVGRPRERKATVIYSSMYGFVEEAVNYVIAKLKSLAWDVHIHRATDSDRFNEAEALSDIADSALIVIGTATYEAEVFPYIRYMLELITMKANFDKPVLVITSYGWGGVAGKKIREVLEKEGFHTVEVVEVRGRPVEEDYVKIDTALTRLIAGQSTI